MKGKKTIIFDLDDTLYDSRQYWHGVFKDISKYLHSEYNVNERYAFNIFKNVLDEKKASHPYIFDDSLKKMGQEEDFEEIVNNCVELYRSYTPKQLNPYPKIEELLRILHNRYKLGILTNEGKRIQKKKIRSLGIGSYFNTVVCCDSSSEFRKPDAAAFEYTCSLLESQVDKTIYIGDNPKTDSPDLPQMIKIRLRKGQYKHLRGDGFDYEVDDVQELLGFFNSQP